MVSILNPICRGTVGYISYLASCSGNTIYSEYLLYEPIMRIAQSHRYSVQCEFPVKKAERGDAWRIDFDLYHKERNERLGLEVKWVKTKNVNFDHDIEKLVLHAEDKKANGYLVLFGPFEAVNDSGPKGPIAKGNIVAWDAGKTDYASRWFHVASAPKDSGG